MDVSQSHQGKNVDLTRFNMEKHVIDCFQTAWTLSEGRPIDARHALQAAVMVSKTSDSSACSKLASLLPLTDIGTPQPYSTASIQLQSFPLDLAFAEAYSVAEPFLMETRVWGRDYITLALLAMADPSLRELTDEAGRRLETIQDEWFLYVTSSAETHRNLESWTSWWHNAGVPLPQERVQQSAQDKTAAEAGQNTYLLTWDPKRHTNDYLQKHVQEFEQRGMVEMNWSVGNHGLRQGDRVFFMRHGTEMSGLIGSGYVVGDAKQGPHWDRTKPKDWTAYYAHVRWDFLSQLPLVPLEELIEKTGEDTLWTTHGSGLPIPRLIAEQLEKVWRAALAKLSLGPSTHIATDIWTLDDTLGYQAYAYAIYRFMTHQQTKPPLTISIQAPWGGGKTSLMRMIQKLLDPQALKNFREESGQQHSDLTVKGALCEIDEWIRSDTRKDLPSIPKDESRKLLTVWFNAWKYESTNQVWAGLADAIMKQVTARLPLAEKERFWLRLNLRRVDAEKIRSHIYERILNYFWRGARGWILSCVLLLLVSITSTVVGWLNLQTTAWEFGWIGIGSSVLIGILTSVQKYLSAIKNIEKEPASVSLRDYLDIPDYNKELGFVHNVEADLHRVFGAVPKEHRPIVIFIDDLDRCSPVKVAQVLEAVNLFLAGDFPHCFFVLGMDSEMVAAALQASHKDMLACLPADASIPLGWRFMDKFVQLPFLIPLPEDNDVTRYTKSLFSLDQTLLIQPVMQQAIESAQNIQSRAAVANEAEELQTKHNLNEEQRSYLQEKLETQVVRRVLDDGIDTFTDKNPEIQRVIGTATSYFCGNPRELKRFINVFRFHYFVWWARKARELEIPTLDQLLRWTVLSIKWPEAVRWVRRGGGTDWCAQTIGQEKSNCMPAETSRLKLIEDISGIATDLRTWQDQALQVLRLTPKDAPWLNDSQLLHYFHDEHTKYPEGKRMSDGEGKGLW